MKQRQRNCIRFESVRCTRCPFNTFFNSTTAVIIWHAQLPVRHSHKACLNPKKSTRRQTHETAWLNQVFLCYNRVHFEHSKYNSLFLHSNVFKHASIQGFKFKIVCAHSIVITLRKLWGSLRPAP